MYFKRPPWNFESISEPWKKEDSPPSKACSIYGRPPLSFFSFDSKTDWTTLHFQEYPILSGSFFLAESFCPRWIFNNYLIMEKKISTSNSPLFTDTQLWVPSITRKTCYVICLDFLYERSLYWCSVLKSICLVAACDSATNWTTLQFLEHTILSLLLFHLLLILFYFYFFFYFIFFFWQISCALWS